MKSRIRGMEQFDKKTQEAITKTAQHEIEENLDGLMCGMMEVMLWADHREHGHGKARMLRTIQRVLQDYDMARERYGIGKSEKPMSEKRRRAAVGMSYQQLVHQRLIEYGIDVRQIMDNPDGWGMAQPSEDGKK